MSKLKVMIVAVFSIFTIATVSSQTTESQPIDQKERVKKSPEERMERRMEEMTKNLSLSETQAAQIKKIQEDYAVKEKIERKARKARIAEQEAKIKAILTPEQVQKFEAAKTDRKNNRKHRKGHKGMRSHKNMDNNEGVVAPDGQR